MWKRRDVDPGKTYRLLLCQEGSRRYYLLSEVTRNEEGEHIVFATQEVPHKLLVSGNLAAISKAVLLTNGQRFFVEAHGIWLTEEEANAFGKVPFNQVPWYAGIVPQFPPK